MRGFEASSPLDLRIKEIFGKKGSGDMDSVWKIVDLLLYEGTKSSDLLELYRILEFKDFVNVVALVDGREIRIPSKQQIEDILITALVYYEKELNGKSWKEIKREYPELPINSMKISYKIRNLNDFIRQRLTEVLRNG